MPEEWVETNKEDSAWYNYGNAVVNSPSLKGNMTPVIYTGTAAGNKWANAITEDGSMFVWIPRYAYKITSNYHTNTAGTIEIKFIDTNNNFLDGTSGKPETDPTKITYTGNANQSTTQNAYGVYDLNGGAPEYVASYVNSGGGNLTNSGADLIIDGNSEVATSTAYKTVYAITNNSQAEGYNLSSSKKGDAIYEISNSYNSLTGTWYSTYSDFPYSNYPFFVRGGNGNSNSSNTSSFYFNYSTGGSSSYGFRVCLAF